MKVYLVVYMGEVDYPYEVLENLELIPESKMVETVKQMIEDERINQDLILDEEYNINNMTVKDAVKLLEDDGWTVKEYDL